MRAPLTARSAAIAPLTAWLLANGARLDGVKASWLGHGMGVGVVATRDLPKGHVAATVPRALLLTVDSAAHDDPQLGALLEVLSAEGVLQDEHNGYDESTGVLALQLLAAAAAQQRGDVSRFGPYVRTLPSSVDTPLLWPRVLRETLLAGTSLLTDVRELRAASAAELRRLRRSLRRAPPFATAAEPACSWLSRLGLDGGAPCPLSGERSSGLQRWMLANALVRSRAYTMPRMRRRGGGGWERDELVLAPFIDLANHDDATSRAVRWEAERRGEEAEAEAAAAAAAAAEAKAEAESEAEAAAARALGRERRESALSLFCERAVPCGSQLASSYGPHTLRTSLLTFGFVTAAQSPSAALRLEVDPADPWRAEKRAVLEAAGQESLRFELVARPSPPPPPPLPSLLPLPPLPSSPVSDFAPSSPPPPGQAAAASPLVPRPPMVDAALPEVDPSLMRVLRLLALPPAEAATHLAGATPAAASPRGFGAPPLVSAAGVDAWAALASPSSTAIERAAYARLLRECRASLRALEAAQRGPIAGFQANLASVAVASVVRRGEATALRQTIAAARAGARKARPRENVAGRHE